MFDMKNEEDRKSYESNYGQLISIAVAYKPKYIFYVVLCSVLQQIFVQFVSIKVGWNDYDIRFELLNVSFMFVCLIFILVIFRMRKDQVFDMFSELGSQLHEYDADDETLAYIKRLRAESKITKRRFPRLFCIICFVGLLIGIFRRPLNFYLTGQVKHTRGGSDLPSSNFVGGISIPYWFYFEPVGFLYYIGVINEYCHMIYIATAFPSIDSAFAAMAHEICTEFKILHYMLSSLVERAESNYKRTSLNQSNMNMVQFKTMLQYNLKSCVIHHQKVIKMINTLRDINYIILVVSGLGMGIITCVLGVILTLPDTSTALKVSSVAIMIIEILHVYIYCYYSEVFSNLSADVGKAIYACNWTKYSSLLKRDIMIIVEMSKRPVSLSAGGFCLMNLETFSGIINSAYSYFNIIKATSSK